MGNVPRIKEKVQRGYIHWRNIYNKGHAEVSFIKGVFLDFQSYSIYWILAKQYFDLPGYMFFTIIPILLILRIFVCIFIGLYWDKEKLFDKESDWGNIRNPVQKSINNKLLNGDGIKGI